MLAKVRPERAGTVLPSMNALSRKRIADALPIQSRTEGAELNAARAQQAQRVPSTELLGLSGQKRLTKREREVLRLISEGYSNKQGALRMQISPRTFESHRAEAMRKLGARNTADLVRAALLHSID